jgi:[ribosomal protein S18]-alanine N-acetyltransferase
MIQIIEGTAHDIEAVMAVMNNAFDPAFGEGWTQNQLLSSLTVAKARLVLAIAAHDIIGFALTRTVIDETELLMIGVHQQWQRQAIASQLLREIIRYEAAQGHCRIFLEVRLENHARQFYENVGFSEIGRRANYYRGPNHMLYDAVTMGYTLTE